MNSNHNKLSDAEVVSEFKKRRLRLFGIFMPGFLLLFFMLAWDVDVKVYFATFLIWFPLVGWYFSFKYRCPRCNSLPWNPSGPGLTLIPHRCTRCKAPLSDSALQR